MSDNMWNEPGTEQKRRMVGETGYEIKYAIHMGDKEIVFAEDENAKNGMNYFVGNYTHNEILGQYADCQVSEDYLEAMSEFTGRVSKQIESVRNETDRLGLPHEVFTDEHCYPNDYSESIMDKVVAIKADVLRPEYRRGDVQLVYVENGHGAMGGARGSAVFCYHLNSGEHTRFERQDVLGVVKELPAWAAEKLAAIKHRINAEQIKTKAEREVR